MKATVQFEKLQEEVSKDSNILGFFLSGSRGKGFGREDSDYDVYIIVKDSEVTIYKKKYPRKLYKKMDLMVYSLSEFREFASWGSPEWFYRYSFTHVKVLIDKNIEIQNLVNDKGRIPEIHVNKFVKGSLDGYINFVYRSLKCMRDNDLLAARLEAAYSIPLFFDVIFAIHNGRLRPYYKYLAWELENFPLTKLPIDAKQIVENIRQILDTADLRTQQDLLMMMEVVLRKEGHGEIFDEWGEDLIWMKTFKLD